MTNPPDQAQDILRVIKDHIQRGHIRIENPATFLGYKDVLDELRWTRVPPETWGGALERQGLAALGIWARDEQHPAVTGLIINKTTRRPGPGYFKLHEKNSNDTDWWLAQAGASLTYQWSRYLGALDPILPSGTPEAQDLAAPPERVATATYRILRDTELARRVKEWHEFRCQLCSERIELPNGPYAEGHHIQPLGQPNNGPDVIGNILCVCPNCHAKLDYGAIALEINGLRKAGHHIVDQKYIDYHNDRICAKMR